MKPVDYALLYSAAMLSVIPIKINGTKAPAVSTWAQFEQHPATTEQISKWWQRSPQPGVAIIAGRVSQNLEIMDFDRRGVYEAFAVLCRDLGLEDVLVSIPLVETPNGAHLYYRLSPTETVPPSTELAHYREETEENSFRIRTLIETRGEGGYALAPGSPSECHEDGGTYRLVRGSLESIPILSMENWLIFRSLAQSLSEIPAEDEPSPVGYEKPTVSRDGVKRPGDDYRLRGDYEGVLQKHGWTPLSHRGDVRLWRRPGKTDHGLSATANYKGTGNFYVFSTNAAPFDARRSYTPFAVYAILEHGGDYRAAAAALGQEGFGAPPKAQGEPLSLGNKKAAAPSVVASDAEVVGGSEDLDLAMRWADEHRGQFAYVEGDQWWHCDGRIWRYSSLETATASMQGWLTEEKMRGETVKVNRNKVSGVLFLAKSLLGPRPVGDFDTNPNWIPLRNGVYDLEADVLLDHAAGNMVTHLSPFCYDAAATCPRWERFLNEVLVDCDEPCREWISALQLWYGYCLVPDNSLQTSMVWVGEGRNGKGVATRVLQKLVGQRACTSVPIEQLHDPYHRAELHGKLVGLVNEPDTRAMAKNGNWFKAIVGGDEISARRPTEKVFSFTPVCRLVISCNEMPRTRDLSKGYFQRIFPVEWRYNVPPEKRDRYLDNELEAELPGIFNWALAGLKRFRADPRLRLQSRVSQALLEQYEQGEDALGRFLVDTYVRGSSYKDRIAANDIYAEYKQWSDSQGETFRHSARAVGMRLHKIGFKSIVWKTRGDGGEMVNQKAWTPIRHLTDAENDEPYPDYGQ